MATQPHVVVIGAGTVGCALADELSLRGWTRVTVLEQGPLPTAGPVPEHPLGPAFLFQVGPCKTLSACAVRTAQTYTGLGTDGRHLFRNLGGLELATTPGRWDGLKHKHGWAASWGIEASLLTPGQCAGLHPELGEAPLLGGLHTPGDGTVDLHGSARAQAERAAERGVRFLPFHRVTGIERRADRVRAVTTEHGSFRADAVVSCAGASGPGIAATVGLPLPVTDLPHRHLRTGPDPEDAEGEGFDARGPVLRHGDTALSTGRRPGSPHLRAHGYRTEPDGDTRAGIPDWGPVADLVPGLAGRTDAHTVPGEALATADGHPLLGEHPALGGFWVVQAVGASHAAGVAASVAEWIVDGRPRDDLHCCELDRFDEVQRSPVYVHRHSRRARAALNTGVRAPNSADVDRPLRTSPFHERQLELGARSVESAGWECPQWYDANAALPEVERVVERHGWPERDRSPVVGAEALVARARVALFDLTPRTRVEISGPEALSFLQTMTTNEIDREPGAVVHTLMLDDDGRVRGELTVVRRDEARFLVGADGSTGVDWLRRHLPRNGSVHLRDLTPGTCGLGLWGPRAQVLMQQLCAHDLCDHTPGQPRALRLHLGAAPVVALHTSGVGEPEWELHTSADLGRLLWDTLWEAGRDHGLIAAGRAAFDSLRLEEGHRSWGQDVTTEHDPHEVGLGHAVRMGKGYFRGKEALEERTGTPAARQLTRLTVEDPRACVGSADPVHADGTVVGHVTRADIGYTLGTVIAHAWLPAPLAHPGQGVEITHLGERVKATVAADPRPVTDTARA